MFLPGETSHTVTVIDGRRYDIHEFEPGRWELVREPDHFVQKQDGTVQIGDAIYALSYATATHTWTFTRNRTFSSNLPQVVQSGSGVSAPEPAVVPAPTVEPIAAAASGRTLPPELSSGLLLLPLLLGAGVVFGLLSFVSVGRGPRDLLGLRR